MSFQSLPLQQFQRRNQDKEDPRILSWIETDYLQPRWALQGYADDLGIQLNGGRIGAAEAPDLIRKNLFSMTPPFLQKQFGIYDKGNLILAEELGDRHLAAQSSVTELLSKGTQMICLGGGHDYGFPDAAGFLEHCLQQFKPRPIVMNFDAHLDVRPLDRGHHSGTPFRRLLEKYQGKFDFYEIGLQPQCNSIAHRQWAQDHGADLTDLSTIRKRGLLPVLAEIENTDPDPTKKRPLWISLDMDAFSSAWAPGCSQSFATGLEPQEMLEAIDHLCHKFSVAGLGIYEVSPPLDSDSRTAKLAAQMIYRLLFPENSGEI